MRLISSKRPIERPLPPNTNTNNFVNDFVSLPDPISNTNVNQVFDEIFLTDNAMKLMEKEDDEIVFENHFVDDFEKFKFLNWNTNKGKSEPDLVSDIDDVNVFISHFVNTKVNNTTKSKSRGYSTK